MRVGCSVCKHPEIREIDTWVTRGESLRKLSARFGCSTASFHRHRTSCIANAVTSLRQARAQVLAERDSVSAETFRQVAAEQIRSGPVLTAVTVESELSRQFARVNRLQDACDKFLTNPAIPDEYVLDAHASEIKIVWEEIEGWRELGPAAELPENPVWVRRRGTLQEALALAFCNGHARHVSTQPIKFADPRKLVIEAAAELRALVELLARLEGRFRPVEKELGAGDTIQFNTVVNILQSAGVPIR